MLACFDVSSTKKPRRSFNAIEVGVPMDSLQSERNEQCLKQDMVALVLEPIAMQVRPNGTARATDEQADSITLLPQCVDATAEETCPAPTVQMTAQDGAPQLAPAIPTARAPSATAFELMTQLEALASDLAVKGRASSGQFTRNFHERSDGPDGLQAEGPSIRVSPRPTGFESHQFATDRPSASRRIGLASFSLAAVIGIGVTFAWHFYGAWPMKQSVVAIAEPRSPASAGPASISDTAQSQSAPGAQTATAPSIPAMSPELVKQLETITQDLATVRRGVEELAAQQSYIATAQQQLEQLVAKQEQLAAKQERMAQNIAKLQVLGQNARSRISLPPQPRAVPIVPRAPVEPAPQLSSVPHPASHPVPPVSVPP
jgi:hypothetical protein